MDKVKAIKVLKPLVDSYVDYANISMKEEDDDIVEALEMAIEALKALDVPDMNVGDMISRQAAIDAIDKALSRTFTEPCGEMILKDVPSVQPEIIRCKDCKYNVSSHKCLHPESFFLVPDDDFYCGYAERRTDEQTKKGCHYRNIQRIGSDVDTKAEELDSSAQPNLQPTCNQLATDTISRQAALDTIMGQPPEPHYPSWYAAQIEKLPAAQPEQVCVANVTLTDEQVKEVAEKAKNAVISVIEPEPHWIPCSERLPKEKQSVLVTDGSVIWVCDIISTDEGYKWEDSHGYWLDLDEWIAWMKLPELYKEGDGK